MIKPPIINPLTSLISKMSIIKLAWHISSNSAYLFLKSIGKFWSCKAIQKYDLTICRSVLSISKCIIQHAWGAQSVYFSHMPWLLFFYFVLNNLISWTQWLLLCLHFKVCVCVCVCVWITICWPSRCGTSSGMSKALPKNTVREERDWETRCIFSRNSDHSKSQRKIS